ncbi:MAG: hypothetical protein H6618_08755 [Deltaproteobacteria bacterium]|nr:hypothetical protein [Deltaproteobacteria bacterium]
MHRLAPVAIVGAAFVACGGVSKHHEGKEGGESGGQCDISLIFGEQHRNYSNETGKISRKLVYRSSQLIPAGCQRLQGMPVQRLRFTISATAKHTAGVVTELYIENRRLPFRKFELMKGENTLGPLDSSDWAGVLNSFQEIEMIVCFPDIHIGVSERPDHFQITISDKYEMAD